MLIKQMLFTMHLQNYLGFRKKEKKVELSIPKQINVQWCGIPVTKDRWIRHEEREREMNSAVF